MQPKPDLNNPSDGRPELEMDLQPDVWHLRGSAEAACVSTNDGPGEAQRRLVQPEQGRDFVGVTRCPYSRFELPVSLRVSAFVQQRRIAPKQNAVTEHDDAGTSGPAQAGIERNAIEPIL